MIVRDTMNARERHLGEQTVSPTFIAHTLITKTIYK